MYKLRSGEEEASLEVGLKSWYIVKLEYMHMRGWQVAWRGLLRLATSPTNKHTTYYSS